MKRIFSIIIGIMFFTVTIFAQKITFSNDVKNSADENVNQIANVWEKYINKVLQQPDSAKMLYWNSIENALQSEDVIRFHFSDNWYYRFCEIYTYNIKPTADNKFYEINCIARIENTAAGISNVFAVFRVCSAKENDEFKLYNYFYTIKDRLNNYSVDGIEYYYPCYYVFDTEKAHQSSDFLKNMLKKYNFEQHRKINYIVANSLDECNEILGFQYSVVSSSNINAGAFRYPDILLSTNSAHFHELTHSIFDIRFNKAPMILREGITTHYGGNAGIPFEELKQKFKKYFTENSKIDLSDFESLYNSELLPDGTNPYYIVGALLIDYAMKNDGEKAVLRLFEYIDDTIYDMFAKEFGIEREEIHNFILSILNDE